MRPTNAKMGRLVSDSERYSVRANNLADKCVLLGKRNNKFHKTSPETLFRGTANGVIGKIVLI